MGVNRYCKSCAVPVVSNFVESKGDIWHMACFCCVDCGADMGTTPQVDLDNLPICESCFESTSLSDTVTRLRIGESFVIRSRATAKIHKRNSFAGRSGACGGGTVSTFEDLMTKIRSHGSSKSHKGDEHKQHIFNASVSRSSDICQDECQTSCTPTMVGEKQTIVDTHEEHVNRITASFSSRTEILRDYLPATLGLTDLPLSTMDSSESSAVDNSSDRFHEPRSFSTDKDLSKGLRRVAPSAKAHPNMRRRRSTPQTWRVPSTKFEADEDQVPAGIEGSPSDMSMVLHSKILKSTPITTATTVCAGALKFLPKSSSSGHLPGLFSTRGGKPIARSLGGSNKCAGCLKPVFPMEEVTGPLGNKFHKACLKCKFCRKPMDSASKLITPQTDPDGIDVHCRTCWDKHYRKS